MGGSNEGNGLCVCGPGHTADKIFRTIKRKKGVVQLGIRLCLIGLLTLDVFRFWTVRLFQKVIPHTLTKTRILGKIYLEGFRNETGRVTRPASGLTQHQRVLMIFEGRRHICKDQFLVLIVVHSPPELLMVMFCENHKCFA